MPEPDENPPLLKPPKPGVLGAGRPRGRVLLGWIVGLAALAAAVGFALTGLDPATLTAVSPAALLAIAGLVAANLVLSGLLFASVHRAFPAEPAVPRGTMVLLIAGSSLLNYIPAVRAGLLGRAAYLKRTHAVTLRDSAWVLVIVTALTAGVFTTIAGPWLILAIATPDGRTAHALAWSLCVPLTLLLVPGLRFGLGGLLHEASRSAGLARISAWVALRTTDYLAATARLWIAFAALGSPIGFNQALVLSAAGLLVRLLGLTPNGLGLSEWAVAALAAALNPVEAGVAAAAALLDRAVEMLVVLLAGGASIGVLARQRSTVRNFPAS